MKKIFEKIGVHVMRTAALLSFKLFFTEFNFLISQAEMIEDKKFLLQTSSRSLSSSSLFIEHPVSYADYWKASIGV